MELDISLMYMKALKPFQKITKLNNKIQINMALNYGSREEIIKTVKKLNNKSLPISEKNINKYLYTNTWCIHKSCIQTFFMRKCL